MGRFRANSDEVAAKIVDGEAILINLSTGIYYSMDGPAAVAWAMLERGAAADEIAGELADRYGVEREVTASDVENLLEELVAEGLLVPVTDGTAPMRREVELPPPDAYVAPRLDKYTDMQEMLALDPPLPGIEDIPWEPPAA
jgi:hypothetical protein